jgi:hypothetical protein
MYGCPASTTMMTVCWTRPMVSITTLYFPFEYERDAFQWLLRYCLMLGFERRWWMKPMPRDQKLVVAAAPTYISLALLTQGNFCQKGIAVQCRCIQYM